MKYKFVIISILSTFFSNAQPSQVKVNSKHGILLGSKENSGIISFKGVPFAAPPVGVNRWKAPQPVQDFKNNAKLFCEFY